MPYVLSFTKKVILKDPGSYINDCCFGGDVIVERLLPLLNEGYSDLMSNQKDWGWFIWFSKGKVRLAIDVFCDDPGAGKYRIHLSSTVRRWLLWTQSTDLPELDELHDMVQKQLASWLGSSPRIEHLA